MVSQKIKHRTTIWCSNFVRRYISRRIKSRNSLEVQWLGLHTSTVGGTGSIPRQGAKILHAMWHGQKNKKQSYERIKSRHSNRYMYMHVIATQVSNDRWIAKQNIVYTYNGILFSFKKEWNFDIWYNMDGPQKHYDYWSKPDTEDKCMIPLVWGI